MSRSIPPSFTAWNPQLAAEFRKGQEITRHHSSSDRTGESSHRHDYQKHELPPRREKAREQWTDRVFLGSSHEQDTYKWPDRVVDPDPPLPEPQLEPAPWPVVSYHGRCAPGEKAFRDAVIEQEEVRAWREEAKLVPERATFHGEDESAVGKDPLTRAGSCDPHRAKAPMRTVGPPDWTRHPEGGQSYKWPLRSSGNINASKANIAWRQHELAAQAPPPVVDEPRLAAGVEEGGRRPPELETAVPRYGRAKELRPAGGRGAGATARSRASDFHTRNIADVLRPESAPAEPRRVRKGFHLVSAAEWKRQQKENARVAMPGGAREAAADGKRGPLPAGTRGWKNAGRGFYTGAGNEPLRMGPTWKRGQVASVETRDPRAPKAAAGVNLWHKIAANRYN